MVVYGWNAEIVKLLAGEEVNEKFRFSLYCNEQNQSCKNDEQSDISSIQLWI